MRASRSSELLVDALLNWRDTPWGDSVLLPVHDEILAMVPNRMDPQQRRPWWRACTPATMDVPIAVEADRLSYA